MAEATFGLAVENLQIMLIQKADILPGGLQHKARRLKDELAVAQSMLRDADEDGTIRRRISHLREVAQDAEDVIDTFSFKGVDADWSGRRLPAFLPWNACGCSSGANAHNPAREIKSIRTRLRAIIRAGERYTRPGSSERIEQQVLPTPPTLRNEDVLGLEQDVRLLLDRAILGERVGLSVAAIVGLGGIGKTTLARIIYNKFAVTNPYFDCCAWVFVSGNFSLEETMKELVRQLLRPDEDELQILDTMERLPLASLRLSIHRRLSGLRYLVVLDDVWSYAHLEALTSIFPNEGRGSRLVITSRNRDITRQAQYVHEMKILDPNNSWKLFLKTTFIHSNINCPEHLEHIGRDILKKCHGLPLPIKEVGRLLVDKHSPREWEDVLQTMDLSIMSDTFKLSYDRLPPQLKLCFLCLALFRQGGTIRAEKLIQVWIAGGMIPQGDQMEEIAAGYLDNLISSFMIQVDDKTKDDRVKNCRMYDVFQRPSLRKAEDEISLEILRDETNSRPIHKPRHRVVYCTRARFIYSMNQDIFLRSLFFHGGGNFDPSPSYWKSFKLLKVLDLDGFGLEEFPEAVSALHGLKYLGLRNNYIRELPDSLGRLENLRVLDISLNFAVIVPDVIWKMESLRHLYMSEIVCRSGLKIDELKNLRTLTYISADNWIYNRSSLSTMTSLRKLGIHELHPNSNISNVLASLGHLQNLVFLNLRGYRFIHMPSLNEVGYLSNLTQLKVDGLLTELPGADNFPPNLCYLTLANTALDQDPMSVLEKLPRLVCLKLRNAYAGERMVINRTGFRRLQVLLIGELWHLRYVYVEAGAMPELRRWQINSCPYLQNFPRRATIVE